MKQVFFLFQRPSIVCHFVGCFVCAAFGLCLDRVVGYAE